MPLSSCCNTSCESKIGIYAWLPFHTTCRTAASAAPRNVVDWRSGRATRSPVDPAREQRADQDPKLRSGSLLLSHPQPRGPWKVGRGGGGKDVNSCSGMGAFSPSFCSSELISGVCQIKNARPDSHPRQTLDHLQHYKKTTAALSHPPPTSLSLGSEQQVADLRIRHMVYLCIYWCQSPIALVMDPCFWRWGA